MAEFAENYNYFSNYFETDTGNRYLDSDGKWAKKLEGQTYVRETNPIEFPDFTYVLENGYIKDISFRQELEDNKTARWSYHTEMILAVLSYVGAQEEIGMFSTVRKKIIEQIENSSFDDFSFTQGGTEVICNVKYTEYYAGTLDMLIPAETAEQTYYKIVFSMKSRI